MPYVGYISAVSISDGLCLVKKEYPGGLVAELDVEMPAVLGIQAAEEPPRYIAISKVRQAKKSAEIAEEVIEAFDRSGGPQIERMFLPQVGERAEMITGDEDAIATRVVELLQGQGFL
jgi:electron transfer flavoprotein beta subunit